MSYLYMLSGIAPGGVCSPTAEPLKHVWGSPATPGTEACGAVGGALGRSGGEWPSRAIRRDPIRAGGLWHSASCACITSGLPVNQPGPPQAPRPGGLMW
jgi:hypothetical protein